ncbi:MAG: GNAT family N-acetyltransferase [Bacteroidetes bacterium]|nr:MAG: GNAT family N-acetyltransferase [Bacteroidota bacterium]
MITIRQAKEDDVEALLSIYNDIIKNTTAVFEYHPHTLLMRQSWYASKQKDGYPVFVAEEGKKIMGFSSFGPFRAWPAYKYSVENSVYVADGCRGRGIGKLLIAPLIDAAVQRDMHIIVASIEATNESSIRLHQSFGFEEVAHFKQVGFKFGRWLDLKFFQLTLNTPTNPKED